MQKSSPLVRHALLMMVGTCVSRVLGLAREVITAAFFGASAQLDAFNVAYTLANLARQLLAEGALSAAFVPVFSRAENRARALSLAGQAMVVLMFASLCVTVLGIVFAPFLTMIIAPGFDAELSVLATRLTRWMFPFLFFISLAALAMGTLNSLGSFFFPALAPAFSNLTFIISAPLFVSQWGVLGLTFSVLSGGFAHFATQWLWGRHIGATLVPRRPDFSDPDLRQMMALFLPYAAGLSLNQLNPIISRMLGSFLEEGSISVLNYANRVIQLPLGLFVIAISQAVLPQLSRAKDMEEFRATIGEALRFALFIVLPATFGMMIISEEFTHIVFVRGAFGEAAWKATSWALFLSLMGLPGMACSTVVMRGLYALSMPKEAFLTTLFSVASTAVLSGVLMFPLGYGGLALAPSVAFSLSGLLGLFFINKKIKRDKSNPESAVAEPLISLKWIIKSVFAVALMSAALFFYRASAPYNPSHSLMVRILWCLCAMFAGGSAYIAATLGLGFDEWRWIRGAILKK
ncbi:putative lipid II flippase MurJ [Synergistales bacterium]|nr:putative lipid II flippase MurJ [Synergistales bacterium]